jgi:ribosomal peptide maturation radical SAM protein 1
MRIALVATPWPRLDRPSAALGSLAAVVRRARPGDRLDCKYSYLSLAGLIGIDAYATISSGSSLGELLYAAHLYPDRRAALQEHFEDTLQRKGGERNPSRDLLAGTDAFDRILAATQDHARALAGELAGQYDVVGFTTTYLQLFSSLAVSRALKELAPSTQVVLGGSGVARDLNPSFWTVAPYVDYIVQGEGEGALLTLLERIERGEGANHQVIRAGPPGSGPTCAPADLDTLPVPDYDGYAESAAALASLDWVLPIEGSRGCWWNRVNRTGDHKDTCHFCSPTPPYRVKSAKKIANDMTALSEKYGSVRFSFTDMIVRRSGMDELARELERTGKPFDFFYEVRASIHAYEIVRLWEAGLRHAQIGIEGLSSSYLRRLGKGTTTIQNLQAMKTCFELCIDNNANLITHFPGATAAEIDETAANILDAAIAYQPLSFSRFVLEVGSYVHRCPERFGVSNIRPPAEIRMMLPDDACEGIGWNFREFDLAERPQAWDSVFAAVQQWVSLHRQIRTEHRGSYFALAPLSYVDRGASLEVIDRRRGMRRGVLDRLWRDVYLYCMEIRGVDETVRRFSTNGNGDQVRQILETLARETLMFIEAGRCLSLAVATHPHIAAERILRAHEEAGTAADVAAVPA